MTLVSLNGPIENDPWRFVPDEEEAPPHGDITVTLKRFIAERAMLAERDGRLGVRVAPADRVEEIADHAGAIGLIEIAFPAFRDGRGYSSARLLRGRFNYKGDLRAVGDVLEDQVFYMLRSGFTSFDIKSKDAQAAFARAAKSFSVSYQAASDARAPVHSLRAQRNAARQAAE